MDTWFYNTETKIRTQINMRASELTRYRTRTDHLAERGATPVAVGGWSEWLPLPADSELGPFMDRLGAMEGMAFPA